MKMGTMVSESFVAVANTTLTNQTTPPQVTLSPLPYTSSMGSYVSNWINLCFCIFGVIGNVVTIIIFSSPRMRSPINIILTGLAAIDIAVVLLAIPLFALPGLNNHWKDANIDLLYVYAIVMLYPIGMAARTCSVWVFVIITFERYLAVCYPLRTRQFATTRRAVAAVLITLGVSLFYNSIRYWEFKLEFGGSANSSFVYVAPLLRKNNVYFVVYYTAMYLFTHFVVPFLILLVFNIYIIRTMARMRMERRQLSRQEMKEHKTTYMMVTVILIFLLTNSLPYILNFTEAVHPDFFQHPDTSFMAEIIMDTSNLLVVINSSTNCIIYYIFSQKYREHLQLIFKGQCKSWHDSVSESITAVSTRTQGMWRDTKRVSLRWRSVRINRSMITEDESLTDNGSSSSCSEKPKSTVRKTKSVAVSYACSPADAEKTYALIFPTDLEHLNYAQRNQVGGITNDMQEKSV